VIYPISGKRLALAAAFWAALGRLMPDYRERREELRLISARLEWGGPVPATSAKSY